MSPMAVCARPQRSRCGREIIVAKADEGGLACHGQQMEIAQAKPLPSSG